MPKNSLSVAREVLAQEIKGLEALAGALDENFSLLVEKIESVTAKGGRVVLSGMGKSGHIARKIAATLSSTGTPSFFVHPGEASHGDLGMITAGDMAILLSNSGETAELKDIMEYTRRFGVFLAAIVRRRTSALVDAADVSLILPEVAEASPIGVPTTSTAMMLALGDAIAVSLLERRGFSGEDFKTFHPGGKIGKSFIMVRDLMHKETELPLVKETDPMSQVVLEITGKSFGCAAVLDKEGDLAGIITDGDIRRHMGEGFLASRASEVMTKNPATIRPNALAAMALSVMNGKKITSLFVTEEKKPVGIIHIHDCLRAGIG